MSFGWMGTFRQGAWRALRRFILEERKDIGLRIAVIESELRRIGEVRVVYKREADETGNVRVTEERLGLSVTKNSSLVRLMQAYISAGGNPFDISNFFIPDKAVLVGQDPDGTPRWAEIYPYGGVVWPQSQEYNEPLNSFGIWTGGFLPLRKYPPTRLGGRYDASVEAEPFVNFMTYARAWVSQEIATKRNDIEARIVKLCDLREQLLRERDEKLVQAFGGLASSLTGFSSDRFSEGLRIPRIVALIDAIFWEIAEDGTTLFSQPNDANRSRYRNLFEDLLPDEGNTAL